ncbi:MAG: addiction module toxin, HicA family [Lentisphaerae bacterium]|nr:addiction module toxin, HicA family [Lentisphaerota bacterium]
MSTFPAITGSQLIKALRRLGFDVIRIKGSHHFLQHPDGRGQPLAGMKPNWIWYFGPHRNAEHLWTSTLVGSCAVRC